MSDQDSRGFVMDRAAAEGSTADALGGFADQVERQRAFFARHPEVHFVDPHLTYPLRRACWVDENGVRHEVEASGLELLLNRLEAEFGERP